MLSDRTMALVRDLNPWWEGKELAVPEYKRLIFANVKKYMKTKQIIAIVGLRRVGKTVLMRQIMEGIENKENVFYFLFDDLVTQNPDVLEDVLDYYLKAITKKEGRKYIFLDEIQKVPYWQDVLKRFYDTRDDIKFVVSGSASLKIRKSKESLAGRIFDFYMPVLTFREFLELNGFKTKKVELEYGKLKKSYEENLHRKPFFEQMFLEYIFKGAFPEMAREEDVEIIKSYIRSSVIEKIILEDIPAVFEVRRKDALASMLEYCGKETSNLLDITNLAEILGVNYQTARSYIFYLEDSFVIDIAYNYSKSIAKQLRKSKKIHIAHPCITMTMMRYSKNTLGVDELIGRYVESIVFQHSKLLSERIFFWRTPQKEEVDIILEPEGESLRALSSDLLLPVEVKFRTHVSGIKGIVKFMKKCKLKNGIVVTKDLLEKREIEGKTVFFIPAWLFLCTL